MKGVYYIIGIIIVIVSVLVVNVVDAKYRGERKIEFNIVSKPFYLQHTGTNTIMPYNNNNVKVELTVNNYLLENYMQDDINYEISINNDNYLLEINGENSKNNLFSLILERR